MRFHWFITVIVLVHLIGITVLVLHQDRVKIFVAAFSASDELKILKPRDGEHFLLDPAQKPLLTLEANKPAQWMMDQLPIGEGKIIYWPLLPGSHSIKARIDDMIKEINITIFLKR